MQVFTVVCLVVLLGLAAGQMTFTDQWTKKRASLLHKQLDTAAPEEQQAMCPSERVQEVFEQLDRLQKAQQRLTEYLASCAYPVLPAGQGDKQQH